MTSRSPNTDGLSAERAAAVPQLALALWIWDAAGLEPGESAVYTSGSPADRLIGIVAGWRSVRDVIRLDLVGDAAVTGPGVINREISEPQEAVGWLSAEIRKTPGVVAAILTPEAMAADVLLEALPMWARIVLAAPASKPATVDFYNNVHRKGTRIVSVPGSSEDLGTPQWCARASAYLERAVRILKNDRLATQCLS